MSTARSNLVGRALIACAAALLGLAAGFWWGWLPLAAEARLIVAAVLVLAAAGDLFLALRFLGEPE